MPRPLRIEFENAWYHVMNRGAARQNIFNCDQDRLLFLKTIEEATSLFKIEVHAYCLMDNHYHLQIKTPYANLGRAMRHINGVYTQRYNRSSRIDGPLFRGRYKAIVIDKDNYLLQVNRYIHLNPISAYIVKYISEYQWSSYSAYIDPTRKPYWLFTNEILMLMDSKDPVTSYKNFMQEGVDFEMKEFYKTPVTPSILGGADFKNALLNPLKFKRIKDSLTDYRRTRELPKIDLITRICSDQLDRKYPDVSDKSTQKIIRNITIYLCRTLAIEKISDIAKRFQFKSNNTVCEIVKAVERSRSADKEMNKLIKFLEETIQTDIKKEN